jgi:hypothetical protein
MALASSNSASHWKNQSATGFNSMNEITSRRLFGWRRPVHSLVTILRQHLFIFYGYTLNKSAAPFSAFKATVWFLDRPLQAFGKGNFSLKNAIAPASEQRSAVT